MRNCFDLINSMLEGYLQSDEAKIDAKKALIGFFKSDEGKELGCVSMGDCMGLLDKDDWQEIASEAGTDIYVCGSVVFTKDTPTLYRA